MSPYKLHGLLQALAFGLFFPIGIVIAYLRNVIGPNWLVLHVTFQALATICVFTAIIIIKMADHDHPPAKDDPKRKHRIAHKVLGPIIVCLILIHWILALWLKRYMDWDAWYNVHRLTATLIVLLGWIQGYLGHSLTH